MALIDQGARPIAPFRERLTLASQRRFLAGAAFEIFQNEAWHQPVRPRAQI
ncbi:MAG: hypothetical protein ACTHOJ_04020 [Sphingomonas oligoaromativorans]